MAEEIPVLLGEERLLEFLEGAVQAARHYGPAEVLLLRAAGGLTRFSRGHVHQNTAKEEVEVRVAVEREGRVGVATTSSLDLGAVREAAARAAEAARVLPPDPDRAGFAPPRPFPEVKGFDAATAASGPGERAAVVAEVLSLCRPLPASGYLETGLEEVGIANSLGLMAHHAMSRAGLEILVEAEDSTGYAESVSSSLSGLDPGAMSLKALAKAEKGRNPREVPPGAYDVLLEPAAVGTLVQFFGYLAFDGKAYLEGRSPISGRLGEKVASELVTLVDDALDPRGLPSPFDFEGVPKRKLVLIEKGIAKAVCHDLSSARRAGTESTGHGLPRPNSEGPVPLHLRLEPGTEPEQALLSRMERGILVTRFHYSNVLHPKRAVITGMTRDGTFWVEEGEIKYGLKNLRFAQGILDALAATEGVGSELELVKEFFFGITQAPALLVRGFRFVSTTTF